MAKLPPNVVEVRFQATAEVVEQLSTWSEPVQVRLTHHPTHGYTMELRRPAEADE